LIIHYNVFGSDGTDRCYLYYSNDMTMDDGSSTVIAVVNVKDYSYRCAHIYICMKWEASIDIKICHSRALLQSNNIRNDLASKGNELWIYVLIEARAWYNTMHGNSMTYVCVNSFTKFRMIDRMAIKCRWTFTMLFCNTLNAVKI